MADQKPTCLALKCIVEIWQEEFAFKWLMSVMVFFPLLWIGSTFANSDELVWILIYIVTAKNVEPESKNNSCCLWIWHVCDCAIGTNRDNS